VNPFLPGTADYCSEKNIVADVEVMPIQQINEAFDRVVKADLNHRFGIDLALLDRA
jgi:alcohol dehydrogenase (NADP+)